MHNNLHCLLNLQHVASCAAELNVAAEIREFLLFLPDLYV